MSAVPAQVGPIARRTLPLRHIAIGSVQTLRTVTVRSQPDGVIASIHLREGDDMKAANLRVTRDRRPFENAQRMARADLVNARAQVQANEAAVAHAELPLCYSEIRAPIGGRTGQLLLHEGSLVTANDNGFAIVTINQRAPIAVVYAVPETVPTALRAARDSSPVTVQAISHDNPPRTSAGRLEFVDNAVDASTGMMLLKAVLARGDHALAGRIRGCRDAAAAPGPPGGDRRGRQVRRPPPQAGLDFGAGVG